MKGFDYLLGVRFLRWKYQRDIQDIDANIAMRKDGVIPKIILDTSISPLEELEYMKLLRVEFLRITEAER
jgi:hypothetical protein